MEGREQEGRGGPLTFERGALSAFALAEEKDLDGLFLSAAALVMAYHAVDGLAAPLGLLLCLDALLALGGRLVGRGL